MSQGHIRRWKRRSKILALCFEGISLNEWLLVHTNIQAAAILHAPFSMEPCKHISGTLPYIR